MLAVDYTVNEARLESLASFGILDTPPEKGFDSIVELATQLCACPVALVSLVDRERQWFKAKVNFPPCETDLNSSVCAHALSRPDDILVIPDLTVDPRTLANPLVTGDPHIRFYAGAPLVMEDGHVLGSLCVIDKVPRRGGLTKAQMSGLRALAGQVVTQLELRRSIRVRDELYVRDAYHRELFERLTEGFIVGEVIRDEAGHITDWRYVEVNEAWGRLLGIDASTVAGHTVREVIPGIEEAWIDDFAQVVETGEPSKFTREIATTRRWYEGRSFKLAGDRFGVLFLEVTDRIEAEARRAALLEIGDRLSDLHEVADMTRMTAEIVGRTLHASRAGFGRIEGDIEFVEVEPDWTTPGMMSIAGRHRFEDYGDLRATLRRGEALVIDDVTTDPRTKADPAPMLAIGVGALVNMPVRERGRALAVFIVHDHMARHWTQEELGFLRNVADRLEGATARVESERHQALLNNELAHRVKNTMAMVQAVAIQTLKDVPDRKAVAAFTQRVHALSAAHNVLLQSSWEPADIKAVVSGALGNFGQLERFDIGGPDLKLGERAVVSLSMLLHELSTNALKHGALKAEGGRVRLVWRIEPGPAGPDLVMDWIEEGGPAAVEPTSKGFGSRLLRLGLVGTGGVQLRYEPSGFRAELRASVAYVQQS